MNIPNKDYTTARIIKTETADDGTKKQIVCGHEIRRKYPKKKMSKKARIKARWKGKERFKAA